MKNSLLQKIAEMSSDSTVTESTTSSKSTSSSGSASTAGAKTPTADRRKFTGDMSPNYIKPSPSVTKLTPRAPTPPLPFRRK